MILQLLRVDQASMKLDALVAPADPQSHGADGRAVVVNSGNLLARFIIQVPMPSAEEEDAEGKLRTAMLAALQQADELAVGTIGIPVIPKTHGFALDQAARIMLKAAIDYRTLARSLQRATFCLYGQEEHATFRRVLEELES
jgi:O-acetyl-ADP-ribose deacetylase (regulator of RNase III)